MTISTIPAERHIPALKKLALKNGSVPVPVAAPTGVSALSLIFVQLLRAGYSMEDLRAVITYLQRKIRA